MGRLEHINLVVPDIDATLALLYTALPDWRVRGSGESDWYGRTRKWLHFGTGDYYVTLNGGDDGDNRDLKDHSPGVARSGFSVDDVDAIRERLVSRGYEIATIGADRPYRKTIYFVDPAGFEWEFIEYQSENPGEKNMYGGETSPISRMSAAA